MKTTFTSILAILLCTSLAFGQDCFSPPSGYTLYTTTDAKYNPPALTGFITFDSNLIGDPWTVKEEGAGTSATFINNMGRSSTIAITGTGMIKIEGQITMLPATPIETCEQMFTLEEYVPVIAQNPIYTKGCPINIVLVIDESNSMSDAMDAQTIRDAVSAFAHNLNGSDNQLALIEFATNADNVVLKGSTAMQPVDPMLVQEIDQYLMNDYNPVGIPAQIVGGTNWEDALQKADDIVGADLIIVLTDSKPTFFNTSMGMNGIGGEGEVLDMTALKEAVDIANAIKVAGKRMFVITTDLSPNIQPIKDISGNIEYKLGDVGNQDVIRTDYTKASEETLIAIMSQIGQTCRPVEVPTLGEWAVINLSLLFLILGCVYIRNQNVLVIATEESKN